MTMTTSLPGKAPSLFVNGSYPRRRGLVVLVAVLGGALLAYAWSARLVDDTIGFNVAGGLLGHDAVHTPVSGVLSGVLFAFVSGLAGSFTACNVAAFGAVGPMMGGTSGRWRDRVLRPLGWLALGMVPVSAGYGVLVGLAGTHMPQFSTATSHGLSPRVLQAMLTFGLIGLVMLALGLAALGLVPDPLAAVSRRFPAAPLVLLGALIGGFLIGRPYPLFREAFRHAAASHDPGYGAAAFILQSLGNILVMALLFALLASGPGDRLRGWLRRDPRRVTVLTASAFLVAAAFLLVYWDVRLLGRLGYLWFPSPPWS
jgi:hypothetical protein